MLFGTVWSGEELGGLELGGVVYVWSDELVVRGACCNVEQCGVEWFGVLWCGIDVVG